MGKYTKMFESGDYDAMQLGATVQWVLQHAGKKLTGEDKKEFDENLEMLNDGAHWVLEKNNGHGMPEGVPAKIIKLYNQEHGKTTSTRDKIVDKVRGSRAKQKTESK